MKKLISIVLVLGLAAGVLVLAVVASSGQEAAPPNPPWVDAQGRVDPSKMPELVYVAGPNGETVRCANGKLLRVRPQTGPPPFNPTRGVPPAQATEPLVPRCGSGPDGHLNPIVVPISQDPLRRAG